MNLVASTFGETYCIQREDKQSCPGPFNVKQKTVLENVCIRIYVTYVKVAVYLAGFNSRIQPNQHNSKDLTCVKLRIFIVLLCLYLSLSSVTEATVSSSEVRERLTTGKNSTTKLNQTKHVAAVK
jgi:hypothetical protein